MEYNVAVGDRIFATRKTKQDAIETAKAASEIYRDKECRLVYKNWKNYRGTPVFVNGEEVSKMCEPRTFKIQYCETYADTYYVKANSYEEAKQILEERLQNEEEKAPQYCIDSSYSQLAMSDDEISE